MLEIIGRWRMRRQTRQEILALTTDLDGREARLCDPAESSLESYWALAEYLHIRSLRRILDDGAPMRDV